MMSQDAFRIRFRRLLGSQSMYVLKKKLALRYFATLLRPFRNFYWTSPFSSLLCWATGLGIIRECKKR